MASIKHYKGNLYSQVVTDHGKKMQKEKKSSIALGNNPGLKINFIIHILIENQQWQVSWHKLISQGVDIQTCKIQAIEDNYRRTYLSQLYFYLNFESVASIKVSITFR